MPDLSSYSGNVSLAGATVSGNYNSQGILEITITLPSGQTVGPDLAFSQSKARDIARSSSEADAQAITSIAASITDILPSIRNQIDTQATTGTPNTASPAPAAAAGPAATPAQTQPDPPPQTQPNTEVVAELAAQSTTLSEDKASLQQSLETIDNNLLIAQIDLAVALNDPNAEPAEIAAIQNQITDLETARATGQIQLDQLNEDIAVNNAALADPGLNSVPVGDPYVDPNYLPANESFTSPAKNEAVLADLAEQSAILSEDKANLQESLQTIDNELLSKQIDLAMALNDPNAEPAEIAAIQSDITNLETARATGQIQLDQINEDIATNDAALLDPSLSSVPVGDPYVDPNYLPPNESVASAPKNDAVLADLAERSAVLQEDKANLESSLNTIDGELSTAKIKLANALDDPNAEPAEIAAIQNDIDTLETAKATGEVQLEQINQDIADNDAALADPSLSSIPEGDPYVDPNYLPEGESAFTANDAVLDLGELGINTDELGPDAAALGELGINTDLPTDAALGELGINTGLQGQVQDTRAQATAQDLYQYNGLRDWRVKLVLAPDADYLYAAPNPGILLPLKLSGGVVFPYTPTVTVQYTANYDNTDITHSNYKIYQYRSSNVDTITVTGDFTAQDSYEANYVLAVIHFFRSLTKMFYGQDPERGTPPPLVYINGFGEYQFNKHPMVVTGFTYTLPNDVDYVRAEQLTAQPNEIQSAFRSQNFNRSVQRTTASGLGFGGQPLPPKWNQENNYGGTALHPTYVPTKIALSISCLPIISRRDVSQRFSLADYASGELLLGNDIGPSGGGIW